MSVEITENPQNSWIWELGRTRTYNTLKWKHNQQHKKDVICRHTPVASNCLTKTLLGPLEIPRSNSGVTSYGKEELNLFNLLLTL